MKVTIDPSSGFCSGVVHAVAAAERELDSGNTLYCLGEIVHNEKEIERLAKKGLVMIDREQFMKLRDCKVMIRAHGEPPETYRTAFENNIILLDATCPVVLRLQVDILEGRREMQESSGHVVIFGKQDHAEVQGLNGQTGGNAIVVRNSGDLGKIALSGPVRLFSQTTMDVQELKELVGDIEQRTSMPGGGDFIWKDTICRQVSGRSGKLKIFAQRFDVVIFVGGKKSSNGQALFAICRQANPRSYFISGKEDLKKEWFTGAGETGITGATSTPRWLMKEVEIEILKMAEE